MTDGAFHRAFHRAFQRAGGRVRLRCASPRTGPAAHRRPGGSPPGPLGAAGRPPATVAPDRGAASLLVLAVGLLLTLVGVAFATVVMAGAAHRKAQIAADLGALAGAPSAARGRTEACARAARVVTANGARMTHCATDGLTLTVRVELAETLGPDLDILARAEARAGPVTAPAGEPGAIEPPADGVRAPPSERVTAGPRGRPAGTTAGRPLTGRHRCRPRGE